MFKFLWGKGPLTQLFLCNSLSCVLRRVGSPRKPDLFISNCYSIFMHKTVPLVSIIIPIYNGAKWINHCFEGISNQTALHTLNLEICVYNDASTDDTLPILHKWRDRFDTISNTIPLKILSNESSTPKGVGHAKNKAVALSSGEYLCFQDIDDVMLPNRILLQHNKLSGDLHTIVGCKFKREPLDSTTRYTKWANSLTEDQLNLQVFTSNGPTIIMPTWFCHKKVFERVGGFDDRKNVPEDLIFFYKHLDLGDRVIRVDECLLIYTYHLDQATFKINKDMIWDLRIKRLEGNVLKGWERFTIWNAGKQGRKFYKCLSDENKMKVKCFCDVDPKKVGKEYQYYDPVKRKCSQGVEIVHFKDAEPPFVICVKMDMTQGCFENNLKSLQLEEGIDYIMFS